MRSVYPDALLLHTWEPPHTFPLVLEQPRLGSWSGEPTGCPHHCLSPQVLHDTLSEACLRISEDERLRMKALFGTPEGGEGREEPGPACLPDTLSCSAAGLFHGPATSLRSALPNRLGGSSHPSVSGYQFPSLDTENTMIPYLLAECQPPSLPCGPVREWEEGANQTWYPLSPEPAGHTAAPGDGEREAGRGQHCTRQLGDLLLPPLPCHGSSPCRHPSIPPRGFKDEAKRPLHTFIPTQGSVGTGVQILAVSHTGIKLLKMDKGSREAGGQLRVLRTYR